MNHIFHENDTNRIIVLDFPLLWKSSHRRGPLRCQGPRQAGAPVSWFGPQALRHQGETAGEDSVSLRCYFCLAGSHPPTRPPLFNLLLSVWVCRFVCSWPGHLSLLLWFGSFDQACASSSVRSFRTLSPRHFLFPVRSFPGFLFLCSRNGSMDLSVSPG